MVAIRLSGTSAEVMRAIDHIKDTYGLQVRDISKWYPNRGSNCEGRVYVRVEE